MPQLQTAANSQLDTLSQAGSDSGEGLRSDGEDGKTQNTPRGLTLRTSLAKPCETC